MVRLGLFTGSGVVRAAIVPLLVVVMAFASGGDIFSSGPLNAERGAASIGGAWSHAELTCGDCHTPFWSATRMGDRCLECHTDIAEQLAQPTSLHAGIASPATCRQCHPEHQANRKYLAFAKKAELEGFKAVASLFRAAAAAETIHAHNHLRELGGVRSTKENLEEAINGESYEFQKMYPQMIEEAKAEGNQNALRSFNWANEVEKVHAALYEKALKSLSKDAPAVDYYVCQACGYTAEDHAPDECPVCKGKKAAFRKAE